MVAVISFFLGVIFVASNNEIGTLTNNVYISIIFNFIGCGFMGYGTYNFIKNINKNAKKRNDVFEKMDLVLNGILENTKIYENIENLDKNQGKSLDVLEGVNKNLVELVEYNKNNLCTRESAENRFNMLIQEIHSVEKNIVKSRENFDDKLGQCYKVINELREIVEADKENRIAYNKEFRGEISSIVEEVQKIKVTNGESLNNVQVLVEMIKNIPVEMENNNENIILIVKEYIENIAEQIENLLEDLEDQDKKRLKNFNAMINNITEYCENNNDEIELLSEQYSDFEKTIEKIVNQMTEMSKNDIEVMKGFLNG